MIKALLTTPTVAKIRSWAVGASVSPRQDPQYAKNDGKPHTPPLKHSQPGDGDEASNAQHDAQVNDERRRPPTRNNGARRFSRLNSASKMAATVTGSSRVRMRFLVHSLHLPS